MSKNTIRMRCRNRRRRRGLSDTCEHDDAGAVVDHPVTMSPAVEWHGVEMRADDDVAPTGPPGRSTMRLRPSSRGSRARRHVRKYV